jgi:hypothetical protein
VAVYAANDLLQFHFYYYKFKNMTERDKSVPSSHREAAKPKTTHERSYGEILLKSKDEIYAKVANEVRSS